MHIHPAVSITLVAMALFLLRNWFVDWRKERAIKKELRAKKKVFVSYDHSDDRQHLDQFRDWIAKREFDFEVELSSPVVAINSEEAHRIKAALTTKMKQAGYLLVIVGEKSHESDWMRWEIEKAKDIEVNLKLVAIKIDKRYTTPPGLLKSGVQFAHSFDKKAIKAAMERSVTQEYKRLMA